MGKIVAIGGGRYDNGEIVNIVADIRALSEAKEPTMLFIPTAGRDNIDGDTAMMQAFKDNGCMVKTLFLTDNSLAYKKIKSEILGADIIYIGGGDVAFMMETWKKTGADKLLLEAYNNGIIMSGYSAGAVCWFESAYDDCGKDHAFVFVKCLGLFPFCACPHFEGDSWQSFAQAIKTRNENGLALEDGAALIYNNGEFLYTCGNEDGDMFIFDKSEGHKQIEITHNPNEIKKYL